MSLNNYIDLRSDTVTIPTDAMREAMAKAVVGDDVFEEDPTINRLQELAAERMGKEAGLFVSSGTMGNLVAMLTHCQRGDEIIVGDQAHIFYYEAGSSSAVGGIHPHTIPNQRDGSLKMEDIEDAIRSDDEHFPITRMLALENTHNRMGGTYLTPAYTKQVADFVHARGIKLHIDGARIFNAAVAQGINVRELAQAADSVTFCLSKGLSAPVGSVLCGSREFIRLARRRRKVIGGGMRQAGILAAAGIVAMEQMVDRLSEDHANATKLALGIAGTPGLSIDLASVQTNMVYFNIDPALPFDAVELCRRAWAGKVKMLDTGTRRIRAVTHAWVSGDEIDTAIQVLQEAVRR
ncbi:MAG: low-specificity L-threonine aldolase [Chloroflexi bacterium]|nr:low-specificity L-threonine aldolase [Chloroflexota bacterium]MCL5273749.1 low-specificity L-threonine aldolase [Chloroflexota bacterium]